MLNIGRTLDDVNADIVKIKDELLSDGYSVIPIDKLTKGMTVVVPLIIRFGNGYAVYIDRFQAQRCEKGLAMIWNNTQTFHITDETEIFIKN